MHKSIGSKIKSMLTIRNIGLLIFYTLSFLLGLGFFRLDNIILILLICLVLIRQFFCNRIRLHRGLFYVLCFSLSLFFFYELHYEFAIKDIFYFVFFPIGCYLIGSSLATKNENTKIENEKYLFHFFFTISMGLLTRAFLGTCLTSVYYGLFSKERLFLDIWNYGQSFTSVTGVNAFVLLSCVTALPIVLIKNKNVKWYHIALSIFSFIFAIYLTINLQNRAGFLIILLGIILFPFFLMLSNFKEYKKMFLIFMGALLFLIVTFLAFYNFSEVFRNKVNSIPIIGRLLNPSENSYSDRFGLYKFFFNNMLKYPFGGMTSPNGGVGDVYIGYTKFIYVHNTWLDFYKLGGIIPFIFFVLITISVIKNVLDYMIFSESTFFKMFITELVIAMFGLFFFEPVFEANIYFFVIIFMIYGAVERLAKNYELPHVSFSQYQSISPDNYKIVFISNFLSLHQREMHEALYKMYGERYHFISLEETPIDHQAYTLDFDCIAKNEIRKYQSEEEQLLAEQLISEADVIIYGSAKDEDLRLARKKGKILIQLSERLYKESKYQRWRIRSILSEIKHIVPYEAKYQTFCFTLSAYTAYDYEKVNHTVGKCLLWAYWVKDNDYDRYQQLKEKKGDKKIHILFVNRLIDWKHPEKAIFLAEYLRKEEIDFELEIIGTGIKEEFLKELVKEKELENYVYFTNRILNSEVRKKMESAHILISTSDQNEGWGACVNEGMLSGCAVVSSHTTGSAPVLIQNGNNGFVYDFYDDNDLFNKVLILCKNESLRNRIAENAFKTMKEDYNTTNAVLKLDTFVKGLIHRELIFQEKGVLSKSYQRDPEEYRKQISHQYGECENKEMISLTNEEENISKLEKKPSLKRGAIISYLAIFLNIVAGLLYTPWMIKELGQSNYGIYSLASSMISLFAIDLGLGTAVSRFVAKYRAENDAESANKMTGLIFKCFIAITGILLVVLTAVYFLLPTIYQKLTPEEISSLRIVYIMVALYSSVCFVFTPLNGILVGNDKFPEYKLINLISRIINIVLVASALIFNGNLYIYVLAIILAGLIDLIIKWQVVRKKCLFGGSPVLKYKDNLMLQTLIKFSFWAAISSIVSRYIISINPSILGIFCGTSQIAIFTLGSTIEGYCWQFANGLDGMFIPRLSEMNDRNASSQEYTDLMIKIGRLQLLFTGLIIIGFISVGRSFINDIWKLNSEDGLSYDGSYFVALFMLIPCLITFTQEIGNTTLIVKNKIKYNGIATIITAVTTVACSFLLCALFPQNGAICAGIAILIGKTAGNIIYLNIVYKKQLNMDLKLFYRSCHMKILPTLMITLVFGLSIEYFVPTNGILYFGLKVILICVFYFILCWKFVLNGNEKNMILSLVQKTEVTMKKTEVLTNKEAEE